MFGNLILILSSIIILILKASDRMLKKKYRKRYPAIMQWYYMQVVSKNSGIILSSRSENFIDEWSQCDFCFTNFGVILEYSILESFWNIQFWSQVSDFPAHGPSMYTLSWGIHKVAVEIRWPGKLKSMMAVIG